MFKEVWISQYVNDDEENDDDDRGWQTKGTPQEANVLESIACVRACMHARAHTCTQRQRERQTVVNWVQ